MCDPVSIGIAFSLASTAMAAKSQRDQGKAAKSTADYNARVADNQAQDVRNKGTQEENKQRQATAQMLSSQRAALGASGIEIGSGSALQIQRDTEVTGEIDAGRIRSNYQDQASSLETGATLTRVEGANAKIAGNNQAMGTILSGGAKVAGKWYDKKSAATVAPITEAQGFTPSQHPLH